nr:MAG TPA: hypothetical protein [Caudoviricetes sp.]
MLKTSTINRKLFFKKKKKLRIKSFLRKLQMRN